VEKIPGPDGPAKDTWNEHPLGKDAPKRRLTEDAQVIKAQD
jgi:hypothetical protein